MDAEEWKQATYAAIACLEVLATFKPSQSCMDWTGTLDELCSLKCPVVTHFSFLPIWSPGSQLKFMSATAKNALCCWYYWRIGCQHSCLKDRNRKRKTRKHYNFAGQYLSLHCSHAGSFSRRRNCVIHGSLVNSKAEIIGRLIMLGAWYIAKVIRHLGRLNHCMC